MKRKRAEICKRVMGIALSCALAVTMLPSVTFVSSAAEGDGLLKAGPVNASEDTVTQNQPLAEGTGGSTNFRIPAFISVDNGEHRGNLIAAADARYSKTQDGGGLDTIASVSSDMGKTWNYSFPIWFPDSDRFADINATTVIDPALVEAADGTVYCLADVNPTGVTTWGHFNHPEAGTGYVKVDGTDRLALTSNYANTDTRPTDEDQATYEYYVGDFDENGYAPVLKREDGTASEYGVDRWFNLYTSDGDGNYTAELTQKQVNSDTDVQQNVFYRDSVLHVYNTGYIWIVESKDGGYTWDNPRILNTQVKRDNGERALLVSPGKGTTLKNGTIIVPFYDSGDGQENASFIYSHDNGET